MKFTLFCLLSVAIIISFSQNLIAQTAPESKISQQCDVSCQHAKTNKIFQELHAADAADQKAPSKSKECAVFDGSDISNVFIDMCAKLKYVRLRATGTATHFSCPRDKDQLIGISSSRILSGWGEPDFVSHAGPGGSLITASRWTYFIGHSRPLTRGGGFPELSLSFDGAGNIQSVSCVLAK